MMALSGLIGVAVLAYLDDIIVFTKIVEDHLSKLTQVLKTLKENGMTLMISKCKLL